jgi:hypothetical protein
MSGPTFQQIRALVETLRSKERGRGGDLAYGLYSPGRYSEARLVPAGEEVYCVAQCDSLLAMRAELRRTSRT